MFSERWETKEPVEIKGTSYEVFKDFISYFYNGRCDFESENIFDIIDLAEMYQVKPMMACFDETLFEMSFTDDNIFRLFELLENCGFKKLEISLKNYFAPNYQKLLNRADFLDVSEATILGILKLEREKDHVVESLLLEKVIIY